jgi:hypothetical protein
MHKGILIYLSIVAGIMLSVGGGYHIIDNIIEPKGLLFEGIMALSMGAILLMIVMIASTVGKTIMLFGEILEQTTRLNLEMAKARPPQPQVGGIASLLAGINPNNVTITDLSTIDPKFKTPGPEKVEDFLNEIFKTPGMSHRSKDSLEEMSVKRLEEELAKAIKEDNFERAEEINKTIKLKKNPPKKDSDSKDSDKKEE